VLHACKTIAEMRGNDADMAHDYDTLLSMLRN
jgi:chromosomal replication initiator protein